MKDNPGGRIQAITVTRIIGIIWLVEAAVAVGYNPDSGENVSRGQVGCNTVAFL